MKKTITMFVFVIIVITVLDYTNIPTFLGLDISNINWDFYMGCLNAIVVLAVFAITFNVLTEREIEIRKKELSREENKLKVSLLLLKNCYEECRTYIGFLTDETVEIYIVPKIDFNSTNPDIIKNLGMTPFANENIIIDLVKDGQITEDQIAEYFKVKRKFEEYVNMRITFFDAPHFYIPLRSNLSNLLDTEIEKLVCIVHGHNCS